jgi:hypothetical protein
MRSRYPFPALLPLLAVLLPVAGEAGWTNRLAVANREALVTLNCRWASGGLPVCLAAGDGRRADVEIGAKRTAVRLSPASSFSEPTRLACSGYPAAPTGGVVTLSWRRRATCWTLYVEDVPVARLPELWSTPTEVRTDTSSLPPAGAAEPVVQRLGSFRFEDNFLVPEGSSSGLGSWETVAGAWRLHTVTGTVSTASGHGRLSRMPTPARSPNFYSLEGRGTQAVVLAGESFYGEYGFRASVQHNEGTNGIVFLATDDGRCLGFTAWTDPQTGRLNLELWRGALGADRPRERIEALATDLLPGQWLLLEVRLFDDRLACLANHVEVLRRRLPLPSGGRFGLYCDNPEGTRFDDVSAGTHGDLAVEQAADADFHTVLRTGSCRFLPQPLPGGPLPTDIPFAAGAHLSVSGASEPHTWIFGSTADGPRRLDVAFVPEGSWSRCGLVAGWRGADRPGYLLVCRPLTNAVEVRIESERDGGGRCVLDSQAIPLVGRRLVLTLDATRAGELLGSVNGRVAVVCRTPEPVSGASGIEVASRKRMLYTLPVCRGEGPVFRDRFEKNAAFAGDPFMRAWASPEGQWLPLPDGTAWFRGDVLGRVDVRLPAVQPAQLHLAVPEEEDRGACVVAASNGCLWVFAPHGGATGPVARVPLSLVPETAVEGTQARARFFGAHLADYAFWIDCETGILARCRLERPLAGRRMKLSGYAVEQLHQARVERERVLDCLFTESLYNWTINGGQWEVINRFQCDPTWSYMNGENGTSLAALWSAYEIGGDFCVDFYAGTRHGWYERPGDYNLTVLSRGGSTGDGYTITCTGWDPDASQLYTRLLRNGRLLDVSTNYLAPRVRAHSRRLGYEPLIQSGRDVHGAWYGMRLRRAGNRLQYSFDNQPVFDCADPDPLGSGRLGIWTYMNSMMVARVRVTADTIRPRRFAFGPLSGRPPLPAAAVAAPAKPVTLDGRPVEWLDPACWEADDLVSHPEISFRAGAEGRPEMRVGAGLGGGSFLARALVPPARVERLLGWRFEFARHPQARVNFEFSVGGTEDGRIFVPRAHYTYRVCGSDETRGPRRLAGAMERPPAATPEGRIEPVWTPVTVWLPPEAARPLSLVRVDGFGNLQPSDLQQGLEGNPPGAWYAVRGFREIFSGPPAFACGGTTNAELAAIARQAAESAPGALHTIVLPPSLDPRRPTVEWGTTPSGTLGLQASLVPGPSEAVRLSSTWPWPNRLLSADDVQVDGRAVQAVPSGSDLLAFLPRPIPVDQPLTVTARLRDGRFFRQIFTPQHLAAAAAQSDVPPELIDLTLSPAGSYQGFESREPGLAAAYQRGPSATLNRGDSAQDTFLRFDNRGLSARLQGILVSRCDLPATPLVQFRYRGGAMSRVSLQAAGYGVVRFTEEASGAAPVRLAGTPVLDGEWHTWIGFPADALNAIPLRNGCGLSPGDLLLGSTGSYDQTGRYSTFDLDDIATGPVVGPNAPLAFEARFAAHRGLSEAVYAVLDGPAPWLSRDEAERGRAAWRSASTNAARVVPDLSAAADGIHHLVLRGRDRRGTWSRVADVPFLLDRQPPSVTSGLRDTPGRYNGTCLDVRFDTGGGAVPRLERMSVTCDGQAVDLARDHGTISFSPGGVYVEVDWPWLLRRQIQSGRDGQTIALTFSGIVDAAGNAAPDHRAAVTLNYAADKRPPTVFPPAVGTNFLWFAPVLSQHYDLIHNANRMNVSMRDNDGPRLLVLRSDGRNAVATRRHQPAWDPEDYPYLAISLRVNRAPKDPKTAPIALQFTPVHLPKEARRPENDAPFSLALGPASAARDPAILGPLTWEPNRWQDTIVDVRAFLRRETGLSEAPPLQLLGFALADDDSFEIQIRAAGVLMAWRPEHTLSLRAYDASGIAGVYWQGGSSELTVLRPARIALPADDPLWMKARVRDRAGNESQPFLVPIPPNAAGTAAGPVAEADNDPP